MKPGFFDLILVQEDFYIIEAKSSVQHSQSHIECTKGKNCFLRTHDLSFSAVYFFICWNLTHWHCVDFVNDYSLIPCFIIVIIYSVKLWLIFELFNSHCHNSDAPQTVSAMSLLKQNSAVSHHAAEDGFQACFKTGSKNTATFNYGRIPKSSPHHKNILCHSIGWSWHQIQHSYGSVWGLHQLFLWAMSHFLWISHSGGAWSETSLSVTSNESQIFYQLQVTAAFRSHCCAINVPRAVAVKLACSAVQVSVISCILCKNTRHVSRSQYVVCNGIKGEHSALSLSLSSSISLETWYGTELTLWARHRKKEKKRGGKKKKKIRKKEHGGGKRRRRQGNIQGDDRKWLGHFKCRFKSVAGPVTQSKSVNNRFHQNHSKNVISSEWSQKWLWLHFLRSVNGRVLGTRSIVRPTSYSAPWRPAAASVGTVTNDSVESVPHAGYSVTGSEIRSDKKCQPER